jgi:hypothetical protein
MPLVVSVTDATGPVVGKGVIFKVKTNDGLLDSGSAVAPTIIAITDAQGRAQVMWTLGHRAGAGSNSVEAYAVGYDGTALFTASGTQGGAAILVIDTNNDQIGSVGEPLPEPFIAVVTDAGHNRLGGVPVTFSVQRGGGSFNGQSAATVISDSDGRVAVTLTLGEEDGNANNLVEATFPNNVGVPAVFSASGRIPGNPAQTTITGVVLDNANVPIAGVTVRAILTTLLHSSPVTVATAPSATTNAQGQFSIAAAPVGATHLLIDGSTAQRPGTYPSLDYELITVAGRANDVRQPIYLLPINTANSLCVTQATGGGTLTMPDAPGFSLTFAPGQVTFPGGSKSGCVSVTAVHGDKVPMVPGFGQQPQFIVTIQPAGALFNPPAAMTVPNVEGLMPREVTEMYSFDHDIGAFVAIGTGVVSDDGQVIRSSTGVGVLKAGWHAAGPPVPTGRAESRPRSVSILVEAIDQDNPDNAAFVVTRGPVYGGPTPGTSDNVKLEALTNSNVPISNFEWTIAGPNYSAAGAGQTWDLGDLPPSPGAWSIHLKATFNDGRTAEASTDIEVGVRTNDVLVVAWIDPAGVPLPVSDADPELLEFYPPWGAPVSPVQSLLTLGHQGLIAAGSTIHPVWPRPMTFAERMYVLNWMFHFAGNFCALNRCPPSSFANDGDVSSFRTQRDHYKLFNRMQIKYLVENGAFKGAPIRLRKDVDIGVTHNPVFDFITEAGVPGPANGSFDFHPDVAFQVNDGTPASLAVAAFNTLAAPWEWSNIGSRIELGPSLGSGNRVVPQVYPTYFVFENLSKTDTIPQAPEPIGNFTLTPYPEFPTAPFIR